MEQITYDVLSQVRAFMHNFQSMTLRDLFAMTALNGLLSGHQSVVENISDDVVVELTDGTLSPHRLASTAYEIADAMIMERRNRS